MKRLFIKFIFFILLLGQVSIFTALDPKKPVGFYLLDIFNVDDGLPANGITAITQTPDGYIWIGTQAGLARFNGVKFEIFNNENTPILSVNYIRTLLADRSGSLWIGTSGSGLIHYKNKTFKAYTKETGLISNHISCLVESDDNSIWIGSEKGLNRLANNKITVIPLPEKTSSHYIMSLIEDQKGRIWAGTEGKGLILIEKNRNHFESKYIGLSEYSISSLLNDQKGHIWVGTMEAGMFHLQEEDRFFFTKQKGLSNNHIKSLFKDRDENLFIGTYGGGLNLLRGKNQISVFDSQNGLSSNSIYSVYEDLEGNLWIGTNGGGLNRLRDSKITTYTTKNGLAYDIVYTIFEDSSGRIWIGTDGFGVSCLKNGKFQTLTTKSGLPSNKIFSINEGPDGSLWFGSFGDGIARLKDGQFKTYTTKDGLYDNFITSIYSDSKNNLWVGTRKGGLHYFSNNKFVLYKNLNSIIIVILEDSQGSMWVGTNGTGLNLINKNKIKVFNKKNELPSNIVISLHEDKSHTLWCGVLGGGLFRYKDGKFAVITKKNGLPDNVIYSILEDNKNNLWMSSNRGIFSVNLSELEDFFLGKIKSIKPTIFGKEDGMKSIECNGGSWPAAWKTQDGKLWFPTTKGVSVVDPVNLKTNAIIPPVVIEKILIDNTNYSVDRRAIAPPGNGNLEISYAGLSFLVPKKVRFKYKLIGYNEDWVDVGTRRTAYYTKIPPGTYTFRVKACNNDGIWNNTGASFHFNIKPYYYQTWLFYTLIGILIILITIGLIRLRISRIKKREIELIKLVKQRTVDLSDIITELAKANELKSELLNMLAHDLKNPIQAVMGYSELIEKNVKNPGIITDKINLILKTSKQMSTLINDMLSSAVIDSGKVEIKMDNVNISELANFVIDAYREMSNKKEQSIIVAIEKNIFVLGDKGDLRKILDNLISNAIKYSPLKKNIWFTLKKADSTVLIEVEDEGPGFSQADKQKIFGKFQRLSAPPTGGESSTGLGLFILKQLVELHVGEVKVESESGKGSKFIVKFPISFEVDEKLKKLAIVEDLREITDFKRFNEFLNREWRRAIRNKKPISIILINIDQFKLFKYTHKRNTVDDCLVNISRALNKTIKRPGDMLAQYGIENFIVVLSETDTKGVTTIAERIRQKVEKLHIIHENSTISDYITISLGCATVIPVKHITPSQLIKASKRVLNQSIKRGGNQFSTEKISL